MCKTQYSTTLREFLFQRQCRDTLDTWFPKVTIFLKKVSFSYHFFEKSVVFLRLKCRKTTDSKMVTKKFTLHRNFLNGRFTAILLPFSYTLIVRKRQRSLKSLCRFLSIWNLECHFLTLFLNVF